MKLSAAFGLALSLACFVPQLASAADNTWSEEARVAYTKNLKSESLDKLMAARYGHFTEMLATCAGGGVIVGVPMIFEGFSVLFMPGATHPFANTSEASHAFLEDQSSACQRNYEQWTATAQEIEARGHRGNSADVSKVADLTDTKQTVAAADGAQSANKSDIMTAAVPIK